jgi:hypothetical protein
MTGSIRARAGVVRSRMAMIERIVPQRLPRQAVARHSRVYLTVTPECYAFHVTMEVDF